MRPEDPYFPKDDTFKRRMAEALGAELRRQESAEILTRFQDKFAELSTPPITLGDIPEGILRSWAEFGNCATIEIDNQRMSLGTSCMLTLAHPYDSRPDESVEGIDWATTILRLQVRNGSAPRVLKDAYCAVYIPRSQAARGTALTASELALAIPAYLFPHSIDGTFNLYAIEEAENTTTAGDRISVLSPTDAATAENFLQTELGERF